MSELKKYTWMGLVALGAFTAGGCAPSDEAGGASVESTALFDLGCAADLSNDVICLEQGPTLRPGQPCLQGGGRRPAAGARQAPGPASLTARGARGGVGPGGERGGGWGSTWQGQSQRRRWLRPAGWPAARRGRATRASSRIPGWPPGQGGESRWPYRFFSVGETGGQPGQSRSPARDPPWRQPRGA